MLSIKNAIRRPIVSLLGIMLVVSMTGLLSFGIGQAYVADNQLKSIEEEFATDGLTTDKCRNQSTATLQFGDITETQFKRQFPVKVVIFLSEFP